MGKGRSVASSLFSLMILLAAAGCGGGPAGTVGERHAPDGTSLGGAYVPAGFGEGSLWATDLAACDDAAPSGGFGDGGAAGACGASVSTSLKRLDPETGEEQAAVELRGFSADVAEVVFGAGSVWVCSAVYGPGPVEGGRPWDAVYRIDPRTNRAMDRIPVDAPTGLAFGFGSVWVVSAGHGTLSRIDPQTGEVAAKIRVGRGAVDVAANGRSGAVWVAGLYLPKGPDGGDAREDNADRKLSRVDPETMRVVAEVPIRADSPVGGAEAVAVGEGAVWAASVDGRLLKVDPATDRIVADVALGEYSSDLEVSGGSVWATAQHSAFFGSRTRLVRVDPRTARIVGSEDLGGLEASRPGRLAAGGGDVWFLASGAGTKRGALTRIGP